MALTVKTFAGLQEAAQALSGDRSARFLGGGTLLVRAVNEGDQSFSTIVRTTDRALRRIRSQGDRLEIGAGTTMLDVIESRDLEFLHSAARAVGGPAIRSMATVGGNLFAASPYGDFTTALLALDGVVRLVDGGREIALDTFLASRDQGMHSIVDALVIRRPARGDFRFLKVSRVKPKGLSVIAIAAHLPRSGGRIAGARVAYGAMASTPVRVLAVEQALEGHGLDESGIAGAVAAATQGVTPPTDPIATEWYRREVAPVHLKRLLLAPVG